MHLAFLASYPPPTNTCIAVTEEASDRDNNRIRQVDDYLRLRRATSAGRPTLALVEFGLEIPEDVMQHEVVKEMRDITVDLIIFVNVRMIFFLCPLLAASSHLRCQQIGYAFL